MLQNTERNSNFLSKLCVFLFLVFISLHFAINIHRLPRWSILPTKWERGVHFFFLSLSLFFFVLLFFRWLNTMDVLCSVSIPFLAFCFSFCFFIIFIRPFILFFLHDSVWTLQHKYKTANLSFDFLHCLFD